MPSLISMTPYQQHVDRIQKFSGYGVVINKGAV